MKFGDQSGLMVGWRDEEGAIKRIRLRLFKSFLFYFHLSLSPLLHLHALPLLLSQQLG